MASSIPAPLHIIQDSRYAKQDGWRLDDISLCSSGNIAVSGHNYRYQSYVSIYGSTTTDDNSDSRDKPTLLYHKQFTDKLPWLPRYISFIKPNSTEIVTCRYDEVQVIDYNRDVVLRSRKVNGETTCLSVSESQIFIGLEDLDIVNIYDNDLNRIKSIRLKGIRYDWPWDIAAAADILYVCTVYGRASVYSQDSRSILTEYTIGQDGRASSIAVNIQLQIVAVFWNREQVAVYSFNNNNCLVVFNVESGVSRIRISDKGRIVTGNYNTGEVKIYKLAQFFTFDNLMLTLSILLSESDQEELVKYFKISDDILKDDNDGIRNGKEKAARLLSILEKKGFLQDRNFHNLKQAFSHLGSWITSMVMSHVDFYQKHTEKNSGLQTSEDNESCQKIQLDGFSADWSVCDMSIDTCGNMVVVAGNCTNQDKTSLDFVCKSGSDLWFPWVRTKEFEGVSKSERIVSFIDEHKVVTCCGNVIEIISCDTNKTEMKQTLGSSNSIVTCVTVRKGDVYVSFKNSAKILVLNRELQDKKEVTLNNIKSMWPMDLAAVSGKLLVCLKYNSSSQVILFKEENGQKLVEYRNVEDGNKAPQSVAACEETDLVGILWVTDADDYNEKAHGHIALHSLTHGYCLSCVSVALTFHDFECDCVQGCSSGKRLRLTSQNAVVMDDLGGIKFFSMQKVLSEENLSFRLYQTLSFGGCKGFREPEVGGQYTDSSSNVNYHDSEQDGNDSKEDAILEKMSKLCKFLTILRVQGHVDSDIVTNLRLKFTQLDDNSNDDSDREVHADGDPVHCYRFQWDDDDDYGYGYEEEVRNDVDVSFGPNNEIAVSHFRPRTNMRSVYIYYWDKNKEMQPSLSYYRKFDDGSSKIFVSFLHGCRAVICCDDLIEIADFDAYGKMIKSLRQSSAATCMSTKDGDIFVGFKSSEIVVFDLGLVEKRRVTVQVKNREWPNKLTIVSGKLFVCTKGFPKRAVSFNVEDGRQLTEYTYERIQMYDDLHPCSITASESLDLVGISWCGDYEEVDEITLHSLSKGFCISIVTDQSARIIRFSPDNYMFMASKHEGIKYSSVDHIMSFDAWKSGFASSFSSSEYEMLIAFYHLSTDEIIDKVDDEDIDDEDLINARKIECTLEILIAKGYITPTNVTSLKKAFAGLGKLYVDRLHQPLDAYCKYASETCITEIPVSVPSQPSDNIAESLLRRQYSVQTQSNNTCVNNVYQQRNLSQSCQGQPSSQEQVASSLPASAPVTESLVQSAEKRGHAKGDHSATDNVLHAKRLKTGEKERGTNGHMNSTNAGTGENSNTNLNELITQIHGAPSILQLMEEDPPPNHFSPHIYRPVNPMGPIRPTRLQTPLPMVAPLTVPHQSSVDTTSHRISNVQVGLQQANQVMSTPYQVGDVQPQTNLHVGCTTTAQQSHVPVMSQQHVMRPAIQPDMLQTSIHAGPSTAQQDYMTLMSQQQQVMRQDRQPNIPQGLPQPRYPMLPLYRQQKPSPQLQPGGQPVTQQRGPFLTRNLPTSSYHKQRRPQGQGTFLELRQNVVQEQTHNSVHSLLSSVAQVLNPNTGPNTGDLAGSAISQTPHHPGTDKGRQAEQSEHLNVQGNIPPILQLEPPNSLSHELQATERVVEQLQSTTPPGTQHSSLGQANRTEGSEEMKSVVQSCVERVVTPLLKDISDKLGHLLGSSKTRHPQQDIPGTSSQSNNALDSAAHSSHSRDPEHDAEVTSAWESLSEYDRMSLQAFRGMTDDRAELVRRLVEMVFSEEERRNQNCFGKSGKQKLDENKLRKIRHITFYLCPIITKKTDIDKLNLEDVEWKRLCEVIDKANRHFREKLKRQGRDR